MIRRTLLHLSRSGRAARLADTFPGLRGLSRRFVAGNTLTELVPAVRRLNQDGFRATASFLGENVLGDAEADAARDEYLRLIDAIAEAGLSSGLSVKLTQLGLKLDSGRCRQRLSEVVAAAEGRGLFVRIDMEESRVVDDTLRLYRDLRTAGHRRLGVVIQAYLRRSRADMELLARDGASVRLVKGAYLEPPQVAFPRKADVDRSYCDLIDAFISSGADPRHLAVATHDVRMIEHALEVFRRGDVPAQRYEFQMVYGVRADLQRQLRDQGQRVRIYVPYGGHWYPYLVRRLAERPANLAFLLRNLFRR